MKLSGFRELTAAERGTASWSQIEAAGRARLAAGRPSPLAGAAQPLLRWCVERGGDPSLESSWESILAGKGLAVVTGQQPAFFGGPLYTLYKAATAAVLARRLGRAFGVPAIAVFWIVGDDADYGEVASAWLPEPSGRLVRLRGDSNPPGGTMIGRLPAASQLTALESGAALWRQAGGERVAEILRETAAGGESWSGMTAGLLFRLLPGLPLLAIDGADPNVIRAQSQWLVRAGREWPLADLLRAGAEEARQLGHDPALDPALGDRALFALRENMREPLPAGALPEPPVGPNVVLRPPLQDLLFPNAATVCGPAEVRYRAQLGPVYRQAQIPPPPLVSRLRGALLPALDESVLEAGGGYAGAVADPDGFLARALKREIPSDLVHRVEAVREDLRRDGEALAEALAGFDRSLVQLLESAAGKADFQLGRVSEGIAAKARHRLYQRIPRLAHWREFLRPRDGDQERTLSMLTPLLAEGRMETQIVVEAAEEHLRRTLDAGEPEAEALFVLEGPEVSEPEGDDRDGSEG